MFDFSIERTIQKCEIKNGILSGVEEIELKDIPNYWVSVLDAQLTGWKFQKITGVLICLEKWNLRIDRRKIQDNHVSESNILNKIKISLSKNLFLISRGKIKGDFRLGPYKFCWLGGEPIWRWCLFKRENDI